MAEARSLADGRRCSRCSAVCARRRERNPHRPTALGSRRSRCRGRATRWRSRPSGARSTWSVAALPATPCRWSTNTIRQPIPGEPARRCRRGSTISASQCFDGKIVTVGGFIGSVHRGAVNEVYRYRTSRATTGARLRGVKASARLGRGGRARRENPCHRRTRRRQHPYRRQPRGVRPDNQAIERPRTAAQGARPHGLGGG